PIVKRTVRPAVSPQNLSSSTSVHSQPSRTVTSPLSSPVRSSLSQTMQSSSKQTTGIKKGTPQPPQSARAPCNTRPSAKQMPKSPVARDDLNECRYCSRRFAADRLEVHESICGKTAKKKRKIYDATKHRVEGTELEQYVRKGGRNVTNKVLKDFKEVSKDLKKTGAGPTRTLLMLSELLKWLKRMWLKVENFRIYHHLHLLAIRIMFNAHIAEGNLMRLPQKDTFQNAPITYIINLKLQPKEKLHLEEI
ncbi:uncharacterized protein BDFB_011166, partial [Asbolus verrucosus]